MMRPPIAGTLYLVATPIGNLEDITLRAVRILRDVSVIACEDTRRTRGLLSHLDVRTPILSMHAHNERTRVPQIVAMLQDGKNVALVTDAGMPAISDPGGTLTAAATRAGARVVPIPGPSAVTAAVALADFPTDRFAFVGFLPRRRNERKRMLASLASLPMALVLFEAPHRVREALADIEEVLGARRMVLARELTKLHEEVLRGTAAEIRTALADAPRGEITLVIESDAAPRPTAETTPALAPAAFVRRLRAQGLSRRDAARALAVAYRLPSREAYRLAAVEDAVEED